jgi:sensor histidine kinase YesM
MKRVVLILSVLAVIALSSCSPKWYCDRCLKEPTVIHTVEVKDSIVITEVIKDTTITVYLPADSMITVVKVICDSNGLAQLSEIVVQKNRLVMKMKIENGILTQNITHVADSLTFVIHTKEKMISHLQSTIDSLQQTEVKVERYTPRYMEVLSVIGGVFIILIIITVAYNLGKRGLPFFSRWKPGG